MSIMALWPARVPPCFPSDGKVGPEQVVGPSQPSIAVPSHRWLWTVTGQVNNPEHWKTHPGVVETGISLLKGVMVGGCGHCHLLSPSCMLSAPQKRHAPFWQIAGSPPDWGPPWGLPTNSASGHVWSAILSTLHGAGERSPDPQALTVVGAAVHHLPWLELTLLHPVVLGEGAPTVVDTPGLCPPQLGWSQPPPLSLTNLSPSLVLPPSAKLVGAFGGPHLPWCHTLGSPS